MTTKDFSEWLICMDLSDYEDIYSLYRSVEECETYGSFETQIAKGSNNGWIVKATYIDESLHLASEKAKNTFLSMIEKRYFNGMDVEGWYAYNKAMQKDD